MITVKGINDKAEQTESNTKPIQPERDHRDRQDSDLQSQALLAKRLGALVEITGQWAWASWPSRPAPEVREALKGNGWIWCRNKGKWAWRAEASHSRRAMPWDYIVNKYGIRQPADELVEV